MKPQTQTVAPGAEESLGLGSLLWHLGLVVRSSGSFWPVTPEGQLILGHTQKNKPALRPGFLGIAHPSHPPGGWDSASAQRGKGSWGRSLLEVFAGVG